MTEAIGTICQEMIHKAFLLQDSLRDSIARHNLIMNAIKARDERQRKRQCVDIWSVQNVIMKNICRDSRKDKRR